MFLLVLLVLLNIYIYSDSDFIPMPIFVLGMVIVAASLAMGPWDIFDKKMIETAKKNLHSLEYIFLGQALLLLNIGNFTDPTIRMIHLIILFCSGALMIMGILSFDRKK